MSQFQTESTPFPLTVAVTGSAGSGKSIVCRQLARRGAVLIDADQVAREVVLPGTNGLQKVVGYFGLSVLTKDGELDRAALRRRIVSDDRDRKALEAIVHPLILSAMEDRMKAAGRAGSELVVAEVPLLFELDLAHRFDKVVLVRSEPSLKVRRLMERDHVSKADAERLLGIQMADDEKEKHSDFVIKNNDSIEVLIKYVDHLYEMIYFTINNRRQNSLTEL